MQRQKRVSRSFFSVSRIARQDGPRFVQRSPAYLIMSAASRTIGSVMPPRQMPSPCWSSLKLHLGSACTPGVGGAPALRCCGGQAQRVCHRVADGGRQLVPGPGQALMFCMVTPGFVAHGKILSGSGHISSSPRPAFRSLAIEGRWEAGREAEPLKVKVRGATFAPRRRACPTADTAPAQSGARRRDLGPGSRGSRQAAHRYAATPAPMLSPDTRCAPGFPRERSRAL